MVLCAVCCFSLLSMPVVWQHTFLLALPIQVYAAEVAMGRLQQDCRSVARLAEGGLVFAGILIVAFPESWGGFTMAPAPLQALLISVPLFCPLLLLLYLNARAAES